VAIPGDFKRVGSASVRERQLGSLLVDRAQVAALFAGLRSSRASALTDRSRRFTAAAAQTGTARYSEVGLRVT
jgi:hypothetical protein